jgi:hypothetical protein
VSVPGLQSAPCWVPTTMIQSLLSTKSEVLRALSLRHLLIVIVRSDRKGRTVRTSHSGTRFFLKLSSRHVWLTVSKAPEISRDRTDTTCFLELQACGFALKAALGWFL